MDGHRRRRRPGKGRAEADSSLADVSQPPGAAAAGRGSPGHAGEDIGFDVQINSTADHNSIRAAPERLGYLCERLCHGAVGRSREYFFNYCCLDGSVQNVGNYQSDRLQELAEELSGTFDHRPPRRAGGGRCKQTILDDNAYVFCSFLRMSIISRAGVTGLVSHPCDYYEITADLDIDGLKRWGRRMEEMEKNCGRASGILLGGCGV